MRPSKIGRIGLTRRILLKILQEFVSFPIGKIEDTSCMMSLTLVCLYIIIGLSFLLFVNYKFLKLFIVTLNQQFNTDANRNNVEVADKNVHNETACNPPNSAHVSSNIWSIPGPLRIPLLGTKWIYLWKYEMSKIHEVYRGTLHYYTEFRSIFFSYMFVFFFK